MFLLPRCSDQAYDLLVELSRCDLHDRASLACEASLKDDCLPLQINLEDLRHERSLVVRDINKRLKHMHLVHALRGHVGGLAHLLLLGGPSDSAHVSSHLEARENTGGGC